MKKHLRKIGDALVSREARPYELALLRIILGALGIKLGVNFLEKL